MVENILFKPYLSKDYLRIAEETVNWLRTIQVDTPYGRTWIQSPDSKEDFSDYPMLKEKALYGGSAGIGLFYLRLYQATGEEAYLREAKLAADHILATEEGEAFYEKTLHGAISEEDKRVHVKCMPGWCIGYANGPMGMAFFVLSLYQVAGGKKYLDYGIRVADDILSVAQETEDGLHWSEQNDMCGDGSLAAYLVIAYRFTQDRRYLDAARKFGDFLLTKGKEAPAGGKYWNVVDLTIIDFPADVFWVNMAHGTSGVGWIFTILYEATREQRFLDAAEDAAKYIKGIAVGDEDAVLVPYLDSLERGPSKEFYYLSTCHGPAGTSILFQSLYRITGEQEYLDWTKRLSRGIIAAGAPENYSRGYWPSQSLCCGAPGLLEHFVAVYKLTGEQEFLQYAGRTARFIIGQSYVADDQKDIYRPQVRRSWFGNWWRTIPTEVHAYSGLYIGTTGCAWTLLSLVGLEQEKEYVKTFEYYFLDK